MHIELVQVLALRDYLLQAPGHISEVLSRFANVTVTFSSLKLIEGAYYRVVLGCPPAKY